MLGTGDASLMASGTVITKASDITAGVLAIVNSTNTTVTTDQTGTAPYLVRVVQRVGDDLVYSPFINCAKLNRVVAQTGVLPVEQVSYVGYNGTSGLLADAASSDYIIKGIIKNTKVSYNTTPQINHWSHASASSTSESAIAKGLLDSFNAWDKRNPEDVLMCERVAATTSVAALTGTAVIYKLTKGLKGVSTFIKDADATSSFTASTASVTAADAIHVASTGAKTFSFTALVLGSGAGRHLIQIGETAYNVADTGTAAQNATAIAAAINAGTQASAVAATALVTITFEESTFGHTVPMVLKTDDDSTWTVVVVTALSGDLIPVKYLANATTSAAATFDLDTVWQGETVYLYEGTGAAATSSIGIATLNGDTFGLKFTGVALGVNHQTRIYEKVRFELGLDGDFADTVLVTDSITALEGVGNNPQIGIFEYQAQMNDGQAWVQAYPTINSRNETDKIASDLFPLFQTIVDFYDDGFTPVLGDKPESYATVVIATPNSTGHGLIGDVFGI